MKILLAIAVLTLQFACLLFPTTIQASAMTGRYAFVVGNAAYPGAAKLANPVNDARLIAAILEEMDFKVRLVEDASSAVLQTLLDKLPANKGNEESIVLFYFARHTMQINGRNYLLPTDLSTTMPEHLTRNALLADTVIERVAKTGAEVAIIILDACRDSPPGLTPHGSAPGLAPMEQASIQTLVAYATSAGRTALDGDGHNSPFTLALSQALAQPNLELFDIFRQVRRDVKEATGNRQIPWLLVSLESSIILRESPISDPVDSFISIRHDAALGDIHWRTIEQSKNRTDFKEFIDWFPAHSAIGLASNRLSALAQASSVSPIEFGTAAEDADIGGWLGRNRNSCDILASDPIDPWRIAKGVSAGLVNTRLALRLCMKAVIDEPANARNWFHLARTLDVQRRFTDAVFLYQEAERRGYLSAKVNRAYILLNGLGVPAEPERAAELYLEAALAGHPRGRTITGLLLVRGEGVASDPDQGVRWLELAAETGWPQAHNILGDIYRRGEYRPTDYEKARRHYDIAASSGYAAASSNLGRMAEQGQGEVPDIEKAADLYRQAIAMGDIWAPRQLATLGIRGAIPSLNSKEIVDLLELAGERGADQAWDDLAGMFDAGTIIDRDPERAQEYRDRINET